MEPFERLYTISYWSAILSSILYHFTNYLTLNNIMITTLKSRLGVTQDNVYGYIRFIAYKFLQMLL